MDTTDSSPFRPEVAAGDPFIAAGARPHGCISSIVYLGELVIGEDGEEVEILHPTLCRRCHPRDEA